MPRPRKRTAIIEEETGATEVKKSSVPDPLIIRAKGKGSFTLQLTRTITDPITGEQEPAINLVFDTPRFMIWHSDYEHFADLVMDYYGDKQTALGVVYDKMKHMIESRHAPYEFLTQERYLAIVQQNSRQDTLDRALQRITDDPDDPDAQAFLDAARTLAAKTVVVKPKPLTAG